MRCHATALLKILLLLTAFSSTSCILVVGGAAAGTTLYVKGDLETELSHGVEEVAAATERALNNLGLRVKSSEVSGLDAVIESETAGDDDIVIKIEAEDKDESHISIRVGVFGDETLSHRILREIEDEL